MMMMMTLTMIMTTTMRDEDEVKDDNKGESLWCCGTFQESGRSKKACRSGTSGHIIPRDICGKIRKQAGGDQEEAEDASQKPNPFLPATEWGWSSRRRSVGSRSAHLPKQLSG